MQISVVIPAFNEENRLRKTLESVHAYLSDREGGFEIIVVDDGSTDNTSSVVQSFAAVHEGVHLIAYAENRGKGFAVRQGIMAALGDFILFNDADGSSPIEELEKLETAIQAGADVAIGSRAKEDEGREVKSVAHRKLMGTLFNLIVQRLLLNGILDTQCGFKLFERNIAHAVFTKSTVNNFAFDVEVLHIAKRQGARISEVAINWSNVEGSKVNLVLDSSSMFVEILRLSLRSMFGKYRKPNSSPRVAEKPVVASTSKLKSLT